MVLGGGELELSLKDGVEFENDGDFAKAVRHYRRMLLRAASDAERAEVNLHLARVLREDGEPDDSHEVLGDAMRQARAAGDGHLQGLIAVEEGALAEDNGSLRYAAQQYDAAAALLAGTQDEHAVAIKLASVRRRRGELGPALEAMEALCSRQLPPEIQADALDELGAVLIARGEYDRAVEVLTTAVEKDTASDHDYAANRSRMLLAEAYLNVGDEQRARRLLNEVKIAFDDSESKRGMSDYHLVLGLYCEEVGKLEDAAREYRAALRLDSESDDQIGQIRGHLRLASVKRRLGDLPEAQEHLDDAGSLLRGKDEDGVESIALLTETGLLALREPDYEVARRSFEIVHRRAKEDGDARSIAIATRHLAAACREQSELDEARRHLDEALTALEQRRDQRAIAEVLDDLGELLLEEGRWKEAISHLERGLEIDQRYGAAGSRARSQLLLGRAHQQMGHRARAETYLQGAQQEYEDADDDAGLAAANFELGLFRAYEGKYREANSLFKKALQVQHQHSDRVGLSRTFRELSASHRRLGDLDRAEEFLQDAKAQLSQTADRTEAALLNAERSRFALATGDLDEAADLASKAHDALEEYGLDVEAAMCLRTMSAVAAAKRNYQDALELLERAKAIFVARDDVPELDDLYDDLAEVNIAMGDLRLAVVNLDESMRLGAEMGWHHGQGRTQLLRGDVEMKRPNPESARSYYDAALSSYQMAKDEVGQSEAHQRLGDWFRHEGQYEAAIREYKLARRLDQLHRDQHGLARVSRKIGEVYLERDLLERAAEALEQAHEHLQSRDNTERAHLQLALGRLAKARGDYELGMGEARKAVDAYIRLKLIDEAREARQLLVDCAKLLGRADLVVEQMRLLGQSQAGMWRSLIDELHPSVAKAARRGWDSGSYSDALSAVFRALEMDLRSAAGTSSTVDISSVARKYLTAEHRGVPPFRDPGALERYKELVVAVFELIRNPHTHSNSEASAVDTAVALCIASFVAQFLRPPLDTEG